MGGIITEVLYRYGFDHVFETSLGADVMIMEQASLFLDRLERGDKLPLITSSCPAWVQYVEQYYPELIPHLSPLKSPQQITGSLIKSWLPGKIGVDEKDIVWVVISSCIVAKSEATRVEMSRSGVQVVDIVMTTRELARLIRISGLDLNQIENDVPDIPLHHGGTAGRLTGVAGGEAEATMRTIFHRVTGKDILPSKLHRFRINKPFREMTVKAGSQEIRMATVSGLSNAVTLLEEIRTGKREIDLLEVMACPDGCTNGGGQPVLVNEKVIRTRTRAVYDLDNGASNQMAHLNPGVKHIYEDFLDEPGSNISREHLFTTYTRRKVLL